MKLTVLTDNNARIDAYYLAEPGVSYYLEADGQRILFDTGYSDVYLKNAAALGIDLTQIDALVISHGHSDHTGGLQYFPQLSRKPVLYAHPAVFDPKEHDRLSIGSPVDRAWAQEHFQLQLSAKPVFITEHLLFLGQIPRRTDYENRTPLGVRFTDGAWQDDFLPEDSALVYCGEEGLSIITGCSHSGIANITEYAKEVCGETRIAAIIGGFHLMRQDAQAEATAAYLKRLRPGRLCPSHCTCFYAKAAIHAAVGIEDVCVGDRLTF